MNAFFTDLAAKYGMSIARDRAYGKMNGCYATLSEAEGERRISVYVGPQEQPAPGFTESRTMSAAQQICHTIYAATGPDNRYALRLQQNGVPELILLHDGGVVRAVFSDAPEAEAGITLFVSELLPQIASLTRPDVCFCCGRETLGSGCPVLLNDEASVAPMHVPCYNEYAGILPPTKEEKAQQTRATLFAAIGALVGAAGYGLLFGLRPFNWVVAVLIGLLPVLAYDWLKGLSGHRRLITVGVCALCGVLIGTLFASLMMLHDLYQLNLTTYAWQNVSFWAYVPSALRHDPTSVGAIFKLLLPCMIFAGVGCIALWRKPANAPAERPADAIPCRLKGKC